MRTHNAHICAHTCTSVYKYTQKMQTVKHPIGLTKLEARWRSVGGVENEGLADEDDDDLNWIQTAVCSLVLLYCTSICFYLVRCFYRLTD